MTKQKILFKYTFVYVIYENSVHRPQKTKLRIIMSFILKKLYFTALVCFCFAFVSSCGEDNNNFTPNDPVNPIPYPYNSAHFTFYYTSYDSLFMPEISDTLENNYERILADLLTDTVLKTSIHFYATQQELFDAVRHVIPNPPSFMIGASTAKDTIHMMAPKHPSYQYEYMLIVLIHEFTHCVTLNMNPAFANNPRWLWESVALFEAGQFVHPNQLPYMVNHTPPTLAQLNSFSNTQIYEVGYLLAEYIVLNWDRQHLKDMIMTNGNIQQVLGVNTAQFQLTGLILSATGTEFKQL